MNRRQFMSSTAAIAAAFASRRLHAQASVVPPVKTARTPILEVGYHESGPPSGVPVILLHGFPDDAHAYDGVSPILAKAGHRALAVYLRGWRSRRRLART
jgi:pimeloyl-ACP methyl ester carboxylesterase